jgi:hypothetical protein
VAEHQRGAADADAAGCLYVERLLQGKRAAAHQARKNPHAEHRDRIDHVVNSRSQQGHDANSQDDAGKCQQHIH